MRHLPGFLISLILAAGVGASVTFVQPLERGQVVGPQIIEITTDVADVARVDFSVDGTLAGVARTPPFRIVFDFGTSQAPRSITATVWRRGFESSEKATIVTAALTATDSWTVDLVELPLRIRSVAPLRPSDLLVRENGVEQTVREVLRERPPAHFAFIVDRSLSMGDGRLEAALEAVRRGLVQLRPGDTSSLTLFNHHVERPRDAASTPRLAPSGGTSLRDAIASTASPKRTYAIVITDGGDRNSALSEEQALRRVSGTKTVVHALVLGDSHTRFLDRATSNTGGAVVSASTDTLGRKLQSVLMDINSRHLAVYQSHGSSRGWRKIDVRSRKRGTAVEVSRKGYFAE